MAYFRSDRSDQQGNGPRMSEGNAPEREGLLEEAARWFARMRGPDAEANRHEFERWLARGALHRAAYNRAAEIFAMGKLLAEDPDDSTNTKSSAPRPPRRLLYATVATALLIVVATSLLMTGKNSADLNDSKSSSNDHASQLAELAASREQQSIRLADNSLVRLEAGSRIAVQYASSERRLLLERGSARFYVAHEARPFVVYAGGGYVVAHGTVFDVGVSIARRVTVRLIEGVVDVSGPRRTNDNAPVHLARRLHPGEMISFAATADPPGVGVVAQNAIKPVSTATDIPVGATDYDAIKLADLVQLANQRSLRPIRIADAAKAQLRISGKFRIDDTDLLAQRIAGLFDMTIDRSNPDEIVLTAK